MHHWKPARVLPEALEWVLARGRDPAEIHLHLHEARVAELEEQVVGEFAADRHELEVVVVVRELDVRRGADVCRRRTPGAAVRRLSAQHLAEERPSTLTRWLFHRHPPVAERLESVARWKATPL